MKRQLAAVLAADLVGYARLMRKDEAGTLERFTDILRKVLEPLIEEHGGRIVKLVGDGLLVEFSSAVSAVACALSWQDCVETHEEAERVVLDRLQFRIGINLGDVIVQADDIHGDGVNIAARLEAIGEPGSIYISDDVYRQAKGKVDADFEDLGERELKNVAEGIRVYRVSKKRDDRSILSSTSGPPNTRNRPSMVVLPFQNMSADADQDFLADGIVDEIMGALAKFRWLFVIDRNTAFSYKNKALPVAIIAQDLGVRYVLEGTVRRSASRVRINVQLVDATTGRQLSTERYDRQVEDIFDLQDEIAATIVGIIEPELGVAEQHRAKRKPPQSLDAWEQYQRGLWHYWRRDRHNAEEAEILFENATPFQIRSATGQHRRHGGVCGGGKGRGQGL